MSGEGAALDTAYLLYLGPQAIPALDRYLERHHNAPVLLANERNTLAFVHNARQSNWRAWNYQDWQLSHYLQSRNAPSAER
jgi:hypothetical protein